MADCNLSLIVCQSKWVIFLKYNMRIIVIQRHDEVVLQY